MQTLVPTTPLKSAAWLRSPGWDMWILAPAFVSTLLVLCFRSQIAGMQNIPLWAWVTFVLLIDVAHVYATLFRTYFEPGAIARNRGLLLGIPALAWVGGSLLYSLSELYFWRTLAYLAVFHFVRQQFGFMILYSRKEAAEQKYRWLDCAAIYAATIYPLTFWHTHERNFSWFVAGDFFSHVSPLVSQVGLFIYIAIMVAYAVKEVSLKLSNFNWPKNLLLIGTALSWWVGIITVNSDMAFTITNVVSHGIPYMALIWLYHHKSRSGASGWQLLIGNVLVFFLFLAFLAYIEEGLWDGLVWREHLAVFKIFSGLPHISDSAFLALLVPFLSLPQSVHYILDGFIWRVKERNNIWSA